MKILELDMVILSDYTQGQILKNYSNCSKAAVFQVDSPASSKQKEGEGKFGSCRLCVQNNRHLSIAKAIMKVSVSISTFTFLPVWKIVASDKLK